VKYLCLVYLDENVLDGLSEREKKALVDDSLDYDDVLRKSGHLVLASALQRVRTAATVRPRDGKVLVTDGPFAETVEQISGFYVVECDDLDGLTEALREMLPAHSRLEIRPVPRDS
jgi:hypothetical protein